MREGLLPVRTDYTRQNRNQTMIVRVFYRTEGGDLLWTDSNPVSSTVADSLIHYYSATGHGVTTRLADSAHADRIEAERETRHAAAAA